MSIIQSLTMIYKTRTSLNSFVSPKMRQSLMLLSFLIFTGIFYGQNNEGQSSSVLQVEYTKQPDVTITAKQIDYFVKVKNISSSSKLIDVSASRISCDEGVSISDDVELKLLTAQGAVVSKIDIASGSESSFILRTVKKENIKSSSWSCIEVVLKPQGLSAGTASVIIRQLNPNASNFK